jgi:hypothetical protein
LTTTPSSTWARSSSGRDSRRQAAILRADGDAQAIATVFDAIHKGDANKKLLIYPYLQMLPELARGEANTVFVIPSEFTQAFADIGHALGGRAECSRTNGSAVPVSRPSGAWKR